MIHLKCIVMYHANLNSNSINKPFLNYGPLNMSFPFFDFLLIYFNEDLVKNMKKHYENFHNSFQDITEYLDVKPYVAL